MRKLLLIFLTLSLNISHAQIKSGAEESIPEEYKPYIFANEEDKQWFKDAKFGVFMCWGPCVLKKVDIGWGRNGPRPGTFEKATGGIPYQIYDNLYKEFNPELFNAEEIIQTVKKSRAKYLIFLTKHHDGFCMFDAHNTDYKITNSPYGKDIAKEIAEACHKYGIKLFWYYSQPDWYHKDYLTENHDNYKKYMFEQIEQLLTEYGKIDGIWFDHLGRKSSEFDTPRLLKLIRTLQPGILVNDRWGRFMPGISVRGDFDTPEQEIGDYVIDRVWETCATMCRAWSWTGGNNTKSFETSLRLLIQTAGAGGNLALNTGPSPKGEIPESEKNNFIKIGEWLKKNGESIYATTGGPYKPGAWGVSTRKGNKIYLHILIRFTEGVDAKIELPKLPFAIKKAYFLNGKRVKKIQNNGALIIHLDKKQLNEIDNIIVLETIGNAEEIKSIETSDDNKYRRYSKIQVSSNYSVRYSYQNLLNSENETFIEGKRGKSWWTSKLDDKNPWVEVSFEEEVTFNTIMLAEQIRNCATRKFIIEFQKGGSWYNLYEGTQIGMDFSAKVRETKTQKVRIRFLKQDGQNPANLSYIKFYNN